MMISFVHTDSYAHIFVFLRKAYINACCTFPINNSFRKKLKYRGKRQTKAYLTSINPEI